MIITFILYLITYAITSIILSKRKIKYYNFPKLYLKRYGIVFTTNKRHRILINDCKIMQVDKVVYIKKGNKMITLVNVDNIICENSFLYFEGLGSVKILFDCKNFYKYFNIQILSCMIDVNMLKRKAMLDIINNIFDINKAFIFRKYLKVINKVLNITISNNKVIVKENKFKIPFVLKYKINNVIKCVNINETF